MTTPSSEEIGAEIVQNGQHNSNAGGGTVSDEGGSTKETSLEEEEQTEEMANGETAAGVVVKEDGAKSAAADGADDEDEEMAMNEDGSPDDRELNTKTPPASERRQSPPLSANTRASTRKRRSAAPIFHSSGGRTKRVSINITKNSNISKNDTSSNNVDKTSTGNTSADDPFNFSTQSDVHPEPLKNISIERSSFNEVKFTKSLPSSADRYANMEKIAASRNPQLAASLSAQPSNSKDTSLSHLSSMTCTRLDFGDTPKSSSGIAQHATITKIALSGGGSATRKRRSGASTTTGTPRSASAAKKPRSATKTRRKRSARASTVDEDEDEEEEEEEEEYQQVAEDDQSLRMEVDNSEQPPTSSGRRGRKRGTSPKGTPAALLSTPKTPAGVPKTPERGSLRRSTGIDSARKASQEQKQKEELLYAVPTLTPMEQLAVDCPQDHHLFMGIGARVLALWGTDYYSANICGREALGRYYVHFVEDNLNRMLPPTGVIPVSVLKPGTRVSFIDTVDGEEIGKVCEVVEQPATDDANRWAHGEFKLRELDEEAMPSDVLKSVLWAKLFLTKEQGHFLLQQLKEQKTLIAGCRTSQKLNPVQDIDEENIISDARSFRRSRSTALARLSSSSTSTFVQPPPMAVADSSEENDSFDTESVTTTETPPHTPRRASRQQQKQQKPATPVPAKVDTSISSVAGESGDTPIPRNTTLRRRGSRSSPRLAPVVESTDNENKEEPPEEQQQEEEEKKPTNEQVEEEEQKKTDKEKTDEEKTEQPDSNGADDEQQKEEQQQVASVVVKASDDGEAETVAPQQRPQKEDDKVEQISPKAATSAADSEQTAPAKRLNIADESAIFAGLKFVLTSATRPNKKATDFNKRDYRKKIEERGGHIIEDFTHPLAANETAYLIADTYYRTHKYLSALSLSIPCVSYKWIQQCVSEKKLTDHKEFLLPAGESSLDSKQQFEWKPLKGVLMTGKRVLIWSNTAESDPSIVSFAEIWTPILQNLGATLVGTGPGELFAPKSGATLEEKLAFFSKIEPPVDVLLAETDCQAEVVKVVEGRAGLAVSSEWVIQAIVTGSLPDLNEPGGEKFRYDFV